jgi:hypothetical protein
MEHGARAGDLHGVKALEGTEEELAVYFASAHIG